MNLEHFLGGAIPPWVLVALIYLIYTGAVLFMKGVILRIIAKLARTSKSELDDVFLKAADFPLTLLILASGGGLVQLFLPVSQGHDWAPYFVYGFKAATILAIVLFVDGLIAGIISIYSEKVYILKAAGSIPQGIARVIVFALGALVLLDSFGVSITPIIASLGIGSLAVALALQPTLENLFAGVQLITDQPIRIGDFIKLETGEEGYVHKIGWRSTWIRLLPDIIVIMPNKVLVNSKVLNYHYPEPQLNFKVDVGVHYGSDLERVERVTLEVARETLREVPGAVKSFEPAIRFHTFDSSSINFVVVLRVTDYEQNFFVKHEFIKRLHKRYAKEGIVIPYPIRAINYDQEKSTAK